MKKENLPPVGTKVYHFEHGWGTIDNIDKLNPNYPLDIKFKGIDDSFTEDGRDSIGRNISTLSLTEYDLINGGFTPISEWNKPKIGDVGYFWDTQDEPLFEKACIRYGVLVNILKHDDLPYESQDGLGFEYFSVEMPEWYKNNIQQIKAELASPKKK